MSARKNKDMREAFHRTAMDTHKMYDNFSLLVLAGVFAITAFAISAMEGAPEPDPSSHMSVVAHAWAPALFGIISIVLLLFIYRKLSFYANTARNVAAAIERGEFDYGVSEVLSNLDKYKGYWAKRQMKWPPGIYVYAHLIIWLQIAALITAAWIQQWD